MKANLQSISGRKSTFRRVTDVVDRSINPWLVAISATITVLTFGAQVYAARRAKKNGGSK